MGSMKWVCGAGPRGPPQGSPAAAEQKPVLVSGSCGGCAQQLQSTLYTLGTYLRHGTMVRMSGKHLCRKVIKLLQLVKKFPKSFLNTPIETTTSPLKNPFAPRVTWRRCFPDEAYAMATVMTRGGDSSPPLLKHGGAYSLPNTLFFP